MSSSIDKESLVQWVADFACEMAHASHVVLYEADGDELVVAATGRTGRTVIERPKLSFGEGLSGRVAVERRMSQVPNIRKDPRFVTSSANVPADAVSYVGAPLLYKNDLLGVLAVYTRTQIYSEDDLQLISSFAAQAAVAIQNARTYEHQFEIATTMQQSFLPREKLKLAGVEVGGVWEPSQGEVGGDYYDFIPVDDARAVIVLGDVSGKGIRAATYTAMGKYVLRAYAHEDPSPEGLLRRTNAVLASGMEVGTFITMFCALIDVGAATLRYANGGHPDGLLFHPATGEYTPLVSTGMMVGAIPGEDFGGVTIALSPGDLLVLYTDGVLEARHGEELYGSDRLKAFIRANAGLEPEVLARAIHEQVRAFHDTGVADDTCVIVLRFIGKNAQ